MKATLEFGPEEGHELRMAVRATEAHADAAEADRLARDALKYVDEIDPAARADKYADALDQIRTELRRTVRVYEWSEVEAKATPAAKEDS